MAGRILKVLDGRNEKLSLEELQKIEGVGPAKASLIAAALEFARRRIRPEGLRISFPPDVLPLIRHFADRKQEHFICASLNGANEVIATRVVSVGLVNKIQSILAKAFRGELVPQDPNDEPASELLKRIQQERRKQAADRSPGRRGSKRGVKTISSTL